MKRENDYFRYGIANALYKVIDGADTLNELKELVREKYENDEIHIVKLDPKYGTIAGLVLVDWRE